MPTRICACGCASLRATIPQCGYWRAHAVFVPEGACGLPEEGCSGCGGKVCACPPSGASASAWASPSRLRAQGPDPVRALDYRCCRAHYQDLYVVGELTQELLADLVVCWAIEQFDSLLELTSLSPTGAPSTDNYRPHSALDMLTTSVFAQR